MAVVLGVSIKSYRLHSVLGQGGMGTVYLAVHASLGTEVAVKILKPVYASDPEMVRRFLNEARAADALRHANVVAMIDTGLLPDRQPYLMMERLVGESLASRLQTCGTFSLPDALHVMRQVGAAIGAAHALGIVHRDIKPENVFLAIDPTAPGGERVKVLDFGIAKVRDDFSSSLVDTGNTLLGSPLYMSPEQCRGLSSAIDARTDVYALGLLLYHLLCGAPPFTSDALGDVLMMHVAHRPRPPREIEPAIPSAIEAVILRALAKRSDDRPASVAELLRLLSEAEARGDGRRVGEAGGVRVAIERPANGKRERAGVLRRPWALGAVALAALLLSLGQRRGGDQRTAFQPPAFVPASVAPPTHGGATDLVRLPAEAAPLMSRPARRVSVARSRHGRDRRPNLTGGRVAQRQTARVSSVPAWRPTGALPPGAPQVGPGNVAEVAPAPGTLPRPAPPRMPLW